MILLYALIYNVFIDTKFEKYRYSLILLQIEWLMYDTINIHIELLLLERRLELLLLERR